MLQSIPSEGPGIDMTDAFADLFAEAQASQIVWNGGVVYAAYEVRPIPETIAVEFIESKPLPVQGIRFKVRGGELSVNNVTSGDVVFWSDTAPKRIELEVSSRRDDVVSLKFWNVWRGGMDVTQAWLGNAGMRVDSVESDTLMVCCSDGQGTPNFHDLRLRMEFNRE